MEQIEDLLNAPASGAEAPTLARLEEALTEGYAQALVLEAERLRLERRISELARELGELRGLLAGLQQRVREMRRAVRATASG
ncbi:MAG TPA: hypothetical protein VMS63_01945 [Gaiellaceae bacterium]|nr:hypothetical protein [Gaiellaceae bacterium]